MRFLFCLDLSLHASAGKKIWNLDFGNQTRPRSTGKIYFHRAEACRGIYPWALLAQSLATFFLCLQCAPFQRPQPLMLMDGVNNHCSELQR